MLSCKPYQNYFYDNEYQKGLLEVAKAVFNSLQNKLVNKTGLQGESGIKLNHFGVEKF